MSKVFTALLLVGLAGGAQAQKSPSPADARAVYGQIRQTLSQSMLWEKKTPQERRQAVVAATTLRDRADKVMGGSQCAWAAQANLNHIVNMNVLTQSSGTKVFDVLRMMSEAEQLGEHTAACHEEIFELESARR